MQVLCKSCHIGIIQRSLDFIQQAKRRRFQILNSKQKGNSCHGLFSSGKLHHILQFFPRRLCNNPDTGLQHIVVGEFKPCISSPEKFLKHRLEHLLNILKFLSELIPHGSFQFINQPCQMCLCLYDIFVLFFQKFISLQNIFVVLYCIDIHRPQFPDLCLDLSNFLLQFCKAFLRFFP